MLIVCPSCATSYDVEPASLQPNGRQVRCVRCRTVWREELSRREKLLAAAEALVPKQDLPETPPGGVAEAVTADAGAARKAESIDASLDGEPPGMPAEAVAEQLDPASAFTTDATAEPIDAAAVEAPPIAPVELDAGRPPIDIDHDSGRANAPPEDVETFAARRSRRAAKRRQPLWSLSRTQTIILVLVIVDAIVIGWRKDIVRVLPQTASFYAAMGLAVNVRGLSFDNVSMNMKMHEGVPILVVQGDIVNDTGAAVGVPRLKFVMRNAAKQEIYTWTTAPPLARLSPHQAIGFRTRLASPPAESRDVLVRFLNGRDVAVAAR